MILAVTGPSIFVSYRRDDAAGDAGRLVDHLHRRFGTERVFLDIDTIQPGTDFVDALKTSLQQTAVTLVVIGTRWASLRDAAGTRRLDDPRDFVRLEVETALSRGIPVVPVLVQRATLPRLDELPPSLAPLLTRQAATLDHAEFHDDVERLCDRLAPLVEGGGLTLRTLPRRWMALAAGVLVLAIGMAGYRWLWTGDDAQPVRSNADAVTSGVAAETVSPVVSPVSSNPGLPDSSVAPGNDSRTARAGDVSSTPAPRAGPTPRNTTRGGRAAAGRAPVAAAAGPDRDAAAREVSGRVDGLLAEAAAQRRRSQYLEALATLARARELAPASDDVRRVQEDLAMYWMRNIRVERGRSTFTDALKPALAVIDASRPAATGARRADLLAHSGWATFLMWREGNRQVDPADWYREALSLDPMNPYANAMLAHWLLFQQDEDLPRAVSLFDTAVKSGRATAAIRALQLSAYDNATSAGADAERVRAANGMRQEGARLTMEQASSLWYPYATAISQRAAKEQQLLLDALPPDQHIDMLSWAFDAYVGTDEFRRRIRRYYVAMLHAGAGRTDQAVADLRALASDIPPTQAPLRNAVQDALKRLQSRK